MKLGKESNNSVFFLDGFEGAYKSGAYYRSKIAIDINEFESKFKTKVVGMVLEKSEDSDKPSFTIEFYTEVKKRDILKKLENEEELEKEYLEGKIDVAIENSIKGETSLWK